MALSKDPSPERKSPAGSSTDLAQAYRDLARGEQAATALEANLNNLENKLDALLAAMDAMDENPRAPEESSGGGNPPETSGTKKATEDEDKSRPADVS